MSRFRDDLPQLRGGLFLTDGGLETTLIFHDGIDLPDFAAFDLLRRPGGEETLRRYFRSHAAIARRFGAGLVLDSVTWRGSADWGARLGYSRDDLAEANRRSIRLLEELREEEEEAEAGGMPLVIGGCIGPRGDGYDATHRMSASEAEAYHREQIETFAGTTADMVAALTLNYTAEAVGIARAAREAGMPLCLSFTVETDGRLPSTQTLAAAIEEVDAETSGYPSYYMINCAHPTHFEGVLETGGAWRDRIRGIRVNASRRSHAELNESTELDVGDPVELGAQCARLAGRLPALNVLGGCCGTDQRHIEQIATACAPRFGLSS